jgi:hypothetical protein
VKKARTWACLTLAAALTLLGGYRLAEGAVLDRDNMAGAQ